MGGVRILRYTNYLFKQAQQQHPNKSVITALLERDVASPSDTLELNQETVSLMTQMVASIAPQKKSARTNKKKWFDWDCRRMKREVNKLAKKVSKHPHDDETRQSFYKTKKAYKSMLKTKKSVFLYDLNNKSNLIKGIDWKLRGLTGKPLNSLRSSILMQIVLIYMTCIDFTTSLRIYIIRNVNQLHYM